MDTERTRRQHRVIINGFLIATLLSSLFSGSASAGPNSRTWTSRSGRSTAVQPSITAEPASVTVNVGKSASFSVANTGTAPFSYEWKRNGRIIRGATSAAYTTPVTTTSDNGSDFAVVVRNSQGSVTSSVAVLTVVAAPAPVPPAVPATPTAQTLLLHSSASALNFGGVNVSTTSTQTVTVTNVGTGAVTLSGLSVSGPGFNATGISSGTVLSAGQSAVLDATFTPAATGSATGSITVGDNATSGAITINLSGMGATVAHSATLSWMPGDSTATGYNVYASSVSGSGYSKLTPSPISALTYMDGGLTAAQTRYYVVTSVNSSNVESAYSAETIAIIP